MKNINTLSEILLERIKLIKSLKDNTLSSDDYAEVAEKLIENQEELDESLLR